ncbi:hypothetical protein K438DRAFT_1981536 [Mycena galopus ATCC 62051]|nr:hypothetical protein K438DRAFT_1981536 [Mycena galopus ATCC 62051]
MDGHEDSHMASAESPPNSSRGAQPFPGNVYSPSTSTVYTNESLSYPPPQQLVFMPPQVGGPRRSPSDSASGDLTPTSSRTPRPRRRAAERSPPDSAPVDLNPPAGRTRRPRANNGLNYAAKIQVVSSEVYEAQVERLMHEASTERNARMSLQQAVVGLQAQVASFHMWANDSNIGPLPHVDEPMEDTADQASLLREQLRSMESERAAEKERTQLIEKAAAEEIERLKKAAAEKIQQLERANVEKTNELATLLAKPPPSPQHVPQNRTPDDSRSTKRAAVVVAGSSRSTALPTIMLGPARDAVGDDNSDASDGDDDGMETGSREDDEDEDEDDEDEDGEDLGQDELEKLIVRIIKRQRTARERAVAAQKATISHQCDLLWKRLVRQLFRKQYSVKVFQDFAKYKPADIELVKRCDEGLEQPALNEYALHFGPNWTSSLWNVVIVEKLVRRAQAASGQTPKLGQVSDEYVQGLFYGQVKQAQEAWKKARPRVSSTGLETPGQAAVRVRSSRKKEKEVKAVNAAKKRKYDRRTQAILYHVRDRPDLDALQTWKYFETLLGYLGKDGMSSEEHENEVVDGRSQSVYRVKLCVWRAPEISRYMDYIDLSGDQLRTVGPPRAVRRRGKDEGTSDAPPGLPEKIYDAKWLKEQRDDRPYYVANELLVSKEAFELLGVVDGKGKGKDGRGKKSKGKERANF